MSTTVVYKIPDMMCDGCQGSIEEVLKKSEGYKSSSFDLETKLVTVNGDDKFDKIKVCSDIKSAGYDPSIQQ
eukprot:gene10001-2320_t